MSYNSKIKSLILLLGVLINTVINSQTLVYGIPMKDIKDFYVKKKDYILNINQKLTDPNATIEIEEYFHLYYGSAYIGNYSPYGERISADLAYELIREGKYAEAIELSKNQILSSPGFVRPLYVMGIAYDKMGDSTNADIYFNRFYEMLSVPFFSGTGESADSAFVVRSIDDEYLIIGEMGYRLESQALINHNGIPYDLMSVVSKKDDTAIDLYFNIEQPFLLGLKFISDEEDKGKKKSKQKKK